MFTQNPSVSQAVAAKRYQGAGLDPQVTETLVANLSTSGTALAACQGAAALDIGSTENTIVVLVQDVSGSTSDVQDEIRQSIWEIVQAMQETKQAAGMTITVVVFSNRVEVLFQHKPVELVQENEIPIRASGNTAMYDAVYDAVAGALNYEEQLVESGLFTKVVVVVFSDGADNISRLHHADDVQKLVDDITHKREGWSSGFVGFTTYENTQNGVDFAQVAQGMGFSSSLVIDLTNPDAYQRRHAIRQAYGMVSKSIIRQSKTQVDPNASPDFLNVT